MFWEIVAHTEVKIDHCFTFSWEELSLYFVLFLSFIVTEYFDKSNKLNLTFDSFQPS